MGRVATKPNHVFDDSFDIGGVKNPVLRESLEFLRLNGIELKQLVSELERLFDHLHGRQFASFLELGSYQGATAWILSHFVRPGGKIVLVDNNALPQVYEKLEFVAEELTDMGFRVEVIRTKTRRAFEQLRGSPAFEYLHIDADHVYENVSWDFHHYKELVSPSGLIQLHDIAMTGKMGSRSFGVCKLWSELDEHYWTTEIVDKTFTPVEETIGGHVGIGLVEMRNHA